MKKLKTLKRERVNKALDSIFDYALTIVEAPMGYGKTTAVKEFLAANGCPVLWLAFLTADETASFFWDGLTTEFGKCNQEAGIKLKSLGFPVDAPQMANVLSILSNYDFEENTVLVIDDFHYVQNLQIGKFLEQLVKEELENLHIVVITRDTTNLEFAELTAKGLCHIISQKLLKFTEKEIRDYCLMTGCMPSSSDLKKISEYTGGWISLIYLTLLGLKEGIPVGINSAIDELVEKVLYNAYDENIRKFLLKLTVMDSFTAEQASFVTRESRAVELLKRLRRENAFVSYDEAAGVYKIHNVLLDFLREKQIDHLEQKELYKQLGEWYLKHNDPTTAYGYLYRAGETGRILSLLDDKDNVTLELAEFDGWREMFALVPRELLFQYPVACLQYISSLLFIGDDELAAAGVKILDQFCDYIKERKDIDAEKKNHILAETSVVKIFTVFNDAEKMIAFSDEAFHLLNGEKSYLMTQKMEFTFGSPHFLYSYYKEMGQLQHTAQVVANGLPSFAAISCGCSTGCEYVVIAEYALETGDWQTAELNAYKAIYKAKTKEQLGIEICANFVLIRLYVLQGKTAEGLELLKQLRQEVIKANNSFYNTTMDICEGYIYCCLGRQDNVPGWLKTGDMSFARFIYQGMGYNYIVHGQSVLMSHNYIELEILTEVLDQCFSVFNNLFGFIYSGIFKAAAKYRLYGMDAGCAALQEALEIGRADGIILPFAEHAAEVFDMLKSLAETCIEDDYLQKIIVCCERYLESLKNANQSKITLSARELEVLTLAAEGLKRNEIAARLMVSSGTVKTHLQNIYQKLEVGGKTAAIKKAEELKII